MEKVDKIRNFHFSNLINVVGKSIKFLFLFHLFLINIKDVFAEYLKSYQSNSFEDLDSLIEINDYYNLSIFLTTNKKIYMGIPPKQISIINSNINYISLTTGITYNENYILMVCTEDYLLTKVEINAGTEIPLLNYTNNITLPDYSCEGFKDDNYVYISMSHIIKPINNKNLTKNDTINVYTNDSDVNETENISTDDYANQYLEHSIIRIKLNNIDENSEPRIDEINDIDKYILDYKINYYYLLPRSSIFSCEIIKYDESIVIC